VSPPINLLKEKEWDPKKRTSAATVEGVSMDGDGTEGVQLMESECGSPSARRSQMWNNDLNRPRAKATNQMIMGTVNVTINNN